MGSPGIGVEILFLGGGGDGGSFATGAASFVGEAPEDLGLGSGMANGIDLTADFSAGGGVTLLTGPAHGSCSRGLTAAGAGVAAQGLETAVLGAGRGSTVGGGAVFAQGLVGARLTLGDPEGRIRLRVSQICQYGFEGVADLKKALGLVKVARPWGRPSSYLPSPLYRAPPSSERPHPSPSATQPHSHRTQWHHPAHRGLLQSPFDSI